MIHQLIKIIYFIFSYAHRQRTFKCIRYMNSSFWNIKWVCICLPVLFNCIKLFPKKLTLYGFIFTVIFFKQLNSIINITIFVHNSRITLQSLHWLELIDQILNLHSKNRVSSGSADETNDEQFDEKSDSTEQTYPTQLCNNHI